MAEGNFPKIDGDVLFSSEVNFMARPVQQVFIGNGFDVAHVGSGSTSSNHEFNVISAASVESAKYVKISILYIISQNATAATRINTIKLEKKHVGGSYEEILPETVVADSMNDSGIEAIYTTELSFIYEMDAEDISNGIQLKITTTGSGNGASSRANITNIQTILELS